MKILKGKDTAVILDKNGEVQIYIPKNIKEDEDQLLKNCLMMGALSILLTNNNKLLDDLINNTIKDMLSSQDEVKKEVKEEVNNVDSGN